VSTVQFLLSLVRRIFSKEQRRFLKFCIVGGSGVPVNLVFTWLGYRFLFAGFGHEVRNGAAFVLGIIVSIFTNFLLNDLWTWRDREKLTGRFVGRLARFYLVCSVASLIQFGTAMALTLWLHLHYLVSQLVGIALATAVNFVVNNAWTFRSRVRPAEEQDAPPRDPSGGGS
jgi:dolichol-phosphate mannosyltransferase